MNPTVGREPEFVIDSAFPAGSLEQLLADETLIRLTPRYLQL